MARPARAMEAVQTSVDFPPVPARAGNFPTVDGALISVQVDGEGEAGPTTLLWSQLVPSALAE